MLHAELFVEIESFWDQIGVEPEEIVIEESGKILG